MSASYQACVVCGGKDWLELPSHSERSVRSDGAILERPLVKAQCCECGLVQSVSLPDEKTFAVLYRDEYDIYNNRPLSEQFVSGRYTALADAITSSVSPYRPRLVLEVGCGNGAALRAVQLKWPQANCIGLEPVTTAVKAAQENGLNVYQGMIGEDLPAAVAGQKYDVIYSIHVIEHTQNPVEFLRLLKGMLAPQGWLVITCPNARVPNLEIMRTDHHYSMTPYHLNVLARSAGLLPVKSSLCPGGGEDLDFEHNQLLLCCVPHDSKEMETEILPPGYLSEANRLQLFGARSKYFHEFGMLDATLLDRLNGAQRIYCFGTGGWACMLAGYAPGVWERVKACVIDGGSNRLFYGKAIQAYDTLKEADPDGIVVGVNPATQPIIARRLKKDGYNAIRWDDIITM